MDAFVAEAFGYFKIIFRIDSCECELGFSNLEPVQKIVYTWRIKYTSEREAFFPDEGKEEKSPSDLNHKMEMKVKS